MLPNESVRAVTPEQRARLDELLGAPLPDELVILALTHPSAVGEGEERTLLSNQRLEFLGDAVLGLVIAEYLYQTEPTLPEGHLTQLKAATVQKRTLARVARRCDLGPLIIMGRGEDSTGGRGRDSVLADTLEALIGAAFLSLGFDAARAFILRAFADELAAAAEARHKELGSVKNQLQEKTQALGLGTPAYRTVSVGGPAHQRHFVAEAVLNDRAVGRGEGHSKREAESQAARLALDTMGEWTG